MTNLEILQSIESEVTTMYEGLNGVKRLYRALENTDNIKMLASVLRYEPGQLEEDINALGDYIREYRQPED